MADLETLLARIDGLEVRIAHQDQTIDELNHTVTDQWKQIEALTYRLSRLDEQIRDIEAGAGGNEGPEPPPPHY